MEEVHEFKYLGSIMWKTRERAVIERKVVGSLGHMMKGRTVSMEVKRDCVME